MGKINISKFIANTKYTVKRHSPEILTGMGIVGMVSTTVLAVKATPKAIKLLDEKKSELKTEKLPAGEIVKTTWKCYIPSVTSGVCAIACVVGANSVHIKRNAALVTAYKLSETALIEYKDKVVETVGEKKEKIVRDKVNKEKVAKDPVKNKEIILTGNGNTLCYETFSGQYFKSDMETIKKAENVLNRELLEKGYISLNDVYEELGLNLTKMGNNLGWNTDDGLIDIYFSSQLADNGDPCIVIDFDVPPRYNYDRLVR